jgi:hypothetical protein
VLFYPAPCEGTAWRDASDESWARYAAGRYAAARARAGKTAPAPDVPGGTGPRGSIGIMTHTNRSHPH